MVRHLCRLLLLVLLSLIAIPASVSADESVVLAVPYRSQLDDSPFARSNCGPASLAMVLGSYGLAASNDELRDRVNAAQGTWNDYDSGTAIQVMAAITRQYGLQSLDLTAGRGLRRWTPDDVRRHLQAGRPVVAQLWYPGLPGRANASYRGDHYIVLVGFEGAEFLYHDPVSDAVGGPDRRITEEALTAAWREGDLPFAGLAIAGPVDQPSAPTRTPTPRPTATPTITPSPSPTPTVTPTVTASPSPSPTASPSPSPTPTVAPSATPSPTPPPTATPIPLAMASLAPPSVGADQPGPPGADADWPGPPAASDAPEGSGLAALVVTALLLLAARGLAWGRWWLTILGPGAGPAPVRQASSGQSGPDPRLRLATDAEP